MKPRSLFCIILICFHFTCCSSLFAQNTDTNLVPFIPTRDGVAKNGDTVLVTTRFNLHRMYTIQAVQRLGLAMQLYSAKHNGLFATNFDQLSTELDGAINFDGNIGLKKFEFVNAGLVTEATQDKIVFREVLPRKNPDGNWERVYWLPEDSGVNIVSTNGNFDGFESKHMVLISK